MNNKYIIKSLVLLMAVSAVCTSCRFEEDDAFSESASLRLEHTNQAIQKALCAASDNGGYGWVIQYYVAGTDDYQFEGFNLFGEFKSDNSVTLSSNHRYLRNGKAGKFTSSKSVYQMLSEEGSVLAFNTWNDVLTVFVDPVDPGSAPGALVSDGTGMNGDQNLIMLNYSDNEMNFRGERHSARIHFVKLDRPAEQYLADAEAIQAKLQNVVANPYMISKGSSSVYVVKLNSGRMQQLDRIADPLNQKASPLCFTPDGFRTEYSTLSLDSAFSFQEFKYDQSKDVFVETGDNSITLDVAYQAPAEFFVKGMAVKMYDTDANKIWGFDASSDISANISSDIAAIVSAYSSIKNHKFWIGYDSDLDKITVTLQCKLSTTTKRYTYNFDYELGNDAVTLSNPTLAKALDTAGKKIQEPLEKFMNDMAKTFKVEDTDSKWSRQTLKLASEDGTTYVNLN